MLSRSHRADRRASSEYFLVRRATSMFAGFCTGVWAGARVGGFLVRRVTRKCTGVRPPDRRGPYAPEVDSGPVSGQMEEVRRRHPEWLIWDDPISAMPSTPEADARRLAWYASWRDVANRANQATRSAGPRAVPPAFEDIRTGGDDTDA